MDLELKNVSVYSKDLYWMLKAVAESLKVNNGFFKTLRSYN